MADSNVRYDLKSLKAVRGTEGRSIAKWEAQGWELISQDNATLHTTLKFRKAKPPLPVRKILIGSAAAVLLLGILGITSALSNEGDSGDAAVAQASPSATVTATPEESVEQTPSATPSPATTSAQPVAPPDGPITDTTVDALLDRLNAGDSGGINVGDRFRITGELIEPGLWGVGATGDYFVMLKAQGGQQDLPVFVDRSLTTGWGEGTRVEMVVQNVERTIDGETTDGWLLVTDVNTL